MCATALVFSFKVAEAEGLALDLCLAAVIGFGCRARFEVPCNGPATLSPRIGSHAPDPKLLQLTFELRSKLVVFSPFSFNARFGYIFPHLVKASDTRLTPGTVVLLRISGDFSSEEWKKATYERQVAGRSTEH